MIWNVGSEIFSIQHVIKNLLTNKQHFVLHFCLGFFHFPHPYSVQPDWLRGKIVTLCFSYFNIFPQFLEAPP